ncbi:MAG: hypothetical protein DWQ49_07035, partial [Bacteroidetes bacterium]
ETLNEKGELTKVQRFAWVTDVEIADDNVYDLMREARSRWRIESVPQAHEEKEESKDDLRLCV